MVAVGIVGRTLPFYSEDYLTNKFFLIDIRDLDISNVG